MQIIGCTLIKNYETKIMKLKLLHSALNKTSTFYVEWKLPRNSIGITLRFTKEGQYFYFGWTGPEWKEYERNNVELKKL